MSDKIGSDILGYPSYSGLTPKKKKELKAKIQEEKAKKKSGNEDEEKLPDLAIPNDEHTPKLGEHGYDAIQEEAKQVHVNEHKRGRPKKKKETEVE